MISAEAPVLFAKAAEIFINELSLRAWVHTEDNKRRTLQRNDIAMAITKYDMFDFLIDIVPRDDLKPNKRQVRACNENKSCMRVEKREFAWEFSQLSLLDQTRTRVAWELTSESLHERFLNFHCLIKREQELHESWQARVYVRVISTFIAWSNENKSYMRVDKREFTWEFFQPSLLDQTRTRVAWELTSESLRESYLNIHCLIKREQKLHESWQARVYTRGFSTFIAWSNENKSCMRVDKREFTSEFSQLSLLDQTRTRVACMRVDKREFTWEFSQHSLLDQTRTKVTWELTSESLHESFFNLHCLIKREQELHESWQARVYMRVFSTFIAWSNENKSCMRVDKREFTWEFFQPSLLDQTRTRVAWELRSESLHESFLNFHCLIKREQELHESWEAGVYMRVFSTFIAWTNENKSRMRVEKREFTWEFSQLSLLDQTRTRVTWDLRSESLHESFLNFHCLIKREVLHESWEARVYMRVFSTFIAWSNENKSCMRVEKREFTWEFSQLSLLEQTRTRVAWELRSESLHESFLNIHCLIKREQKLHESWQARVYMRVFSTFIAWSNENKSCMRVEKREFTWEFSQLSLLEQTRTRVAWELRSESLHESFLNFHCLIKREQELHETWEARVCMRVFSTFIAWSNEKCYMRVEKREFTWEFSQLSLLDQTRSVTWELTSESLHESFLNFHCLIKREQELHESWQARVYMRVFSTFIAWSNENKSCMRVDKREFTWKFSQLSLLDQTRTRVDES